MSRKFMAIIFLTITVISIAVWLISEFLVPILPNEVGNSVILFFIAFNAIITLLASGNDVIEFFQKILPTNRTKSSPLKIDLAYHQETDFGTSLSVYIVNKNKSQL